MRNQIYNFVMGVGISTFYVGTVGLFCKTSDYLKTIGLNIQKFK
jgi:hypothetical protein